MKGAETSNEKTALCRHSTTTIHAFDFKNASILATVEQIKKRKICEIIEFIKNEKTMNLKSDLGNLHATYSHLIAGGFTSRFRFSIFSPLLRLS